jgi:hypothetical protein
VRRNGKTLKFPDLRGFDENRSRFPADQLLAYSGMYVAWSTDGSRILAAGPTRDALDQQLESAGILLDQVVHDYIEPPVE